MASDASFPRSRRALLAAALGAGAATVASALDRPPIARAGVDGDVVLGEANYSTGDTGIINQEDGGTGLFVSGQDAGLVVDAGDFGIRATAHGFGAGVRGRCALGPAIVGESVTGTGGMFSTPKPVGEVHTGIALQAVGRVIFDRCAGVASVASGAKSIRVTPGVDLVSGSAVVATLQGSAGGALVERVAVSTTGNTFTIHLTKASTRKVKVAWHLFG